MRGFFLSLFAKNLPLKLVSLLLAVLLFVIVHAEKQVVFQGAIPLTFNIPAGKFLVERPPRLLRVSVIGPASKMKQFRFSDVPGVFIDLAESAEGFFKFNEELISLPEGLKISAIKPNGFVLQYENIIKKTLAVHPKIQGRPAPGFKYAGVTVKPASLVVSGPARILQAAEELTTEPVNIDRLAAPIIRHVQITTESPRLRTFVPQMEAAVAVQIRPLPQGMELVVAGVQIIYDEPVTSRADLPQQAKVVCAGAANQLQGLTASSLTVHYRPFSTANGRTQMHPRVEGLPAGVEAVSIEPPVIEWQQDSHESEEEESGAHRGGKTKEE